MIRDTLGSWTMWLNDKVSDPRLVLQYQIEKLNDALDKYKINKVKAEEELKKIDKKVTGLTNDKEQYIKMAKETSDEATRESYLDAAYYSEIAIQTIAKQKELLEPVVKDYDMNTATLRNRISLAESKLKAVEAMILAKETVPENMRLKNAEIDADIEKVMRMAKRQNNVDVSVNIDKEAWKKSVMG